MYSNGSHSQQCGYRFLHHSVEKVYSITVYSVGKVYNLPQPYKGNAVFEV